MTKTTQYLVYRHGSNGANQPMCNKLPVAIVEAKSRKEACETDGLENPTVHDSAWLKLDPSVTCWANQYFSAVPVSCAPKSDVRFVEESA